MRQGRGTDRKNERYREGKGEKKNEGHDKDGKVG